MTVAISKNEADKITVVNILPEHPFNMMKEEHVEDRGDGKWCTTYHGNEDVLYLRIPNESLPGVLKAVQKAIKQGNNFNVLYTANIKLRNEFSFDDNRCLKENG